MELASAGGMLKCCALRIAFPSAFYGTRSRTLECRHGTGVSRLIRLVTEITQDS